MQYYMILFFPLSDLPHSVWQTLGPAMSLQIALFHYFILFYGWVTFHCMIYIIDTTSLSIHLSMDLWVASVSWLLWCNELPGACAVCAKSCPTLCNPVAYSSQIPLSMGFSRQEYWSALPCPSPGDIPNPGIKRRSPALQADSLLFEPHMVFPWYTPRSRIARSYSSSIFSVLRNIHTVLHRGFTNLHSQQQRAPFPPHLLQHLLFVEFLMMAILTSVRWYFTVVWICILILGHVERLFMCLLNIFSCVCWPSVGLPGRNIYLGLLPIFWLGGLFVWYWAAWAICIFWRLIPCQLLHLQIFSPILRVVLPPCLWLPLLCKSF